MSANILSKICMPSVKLMNSLKYPAKIGLLSILVISMCASIIGFLLFNLQTQADFNKKEAFGVEYINPLKNLLLDLEKYRENNPNVTKDKITQDINEVDKVDLKLNKTLLIGQKWSELKGYLSILNFEYNQLSDLVGQTSGLIDHVTNQSNLILDPDLDTYYLMDSYCLRFSNIIGKIFDLKEEGTKTSVKTITTKKPKKSKKQKKEKTVSQQKIVSYFNKLELIKTSVLLREQNEILKSNIGVIYDFNPSVKKDLDEFYVNCYEANLNFLDATEQLINGKKVSPQEYSELADKAIQANKLADEQYSRILDKLINIRVKKYLDQQPIAVLITIVSLLIIGYLFAGFYLSLIYSMTEISDNLFNVAENIESTSTELSASSHRLAEGNSEQAAAIQETAATLDESSSMVKQNTDNTKTAASLAGQAKEFAQKGAKEMAEMMSSMTELKSSSGEISKIIKVIQEIAFQTNILSLNAAVEAARAGDVGKGFAVVAEEVRNLAQRSSAAAKDTALIIENNIMLSDKGAKAAQLTNEALSEINTQIQKVSEIINEVAVATEEQNQGIGQINQAISQMNIVTQNNASIADNNVHAIVSLSEQIKAMKLVVSGLISLINGTTSNVNDLIDVQETKFLSKV